MQTSWCLFNTFTLIIHIWQPTSLSQSPKRTLENCSGSPSISCGCGGGDASGVILVEWEGGGGGAEADCRGKQRESSSACPSLCLNGFKMELGVAGAVQGAATGGCNHCTWPETPVLQDSSGVETWWSPPLENWINEENFQCILWSVHYILVYIRYVYIRYIRYVCNPQILLKKQME